VPGGARADHEARDRRAHAGLEMTRAIRIAVDPAANGRVPSPGGTTSTRRRGGRRARRDREVDAVKEASGSRGVQRRRRWITRIGAMPPLRHEDVSASGSIDDERAPGPVRGSCRPAARGNARARATRHEDRQAPQRGRPATTRSCRQLSVSPPAGTATRTNWPARNAGPDGRGRGPRIGVWGRRRRGARVLSGHGCRSRCSPWRGTVISTTARDRAPRPGSRPRRGRQPTALSSRSSSLSAAGFSLSPPCFTTT
jgi:hypothetical protein